MLAGTLTEFGLPDVFSLLNVTRKTGVLSVRGANVDGRLWFVDGLVPYGVASVGRLPLAARLVSSGLAEVTHLSDVFAAQAAMDVDTLVRVLREQLELPAERVEELLRDQVVDAVFRLLRLSDGDFSFDAGVSVSLPAPRFAPDQLLAAGYERLEEWERVAARLPDPTAALRFAPEPPGDGPVTLAPEQWSVATLIDGQRSLVDVVELAGRGEFATCSILATLLGSGIIEVAAGASDPTAAATAVRELERQYLGGDWTGPPTASPPAARPTTRPTAPSNGTAAPPSRPPSFPERAATPPPAAPAAPAAADEPEPEEEAVDLTALDPAPDDVGVGLAATRPPAEPPAAEPEPEPEPELTRDADVNQGLLLRLIEGVKDS